jgi:hypothetical protein
MRTTRTASYVAPRPVATAQPYLEPMKPLALKFTDQTLKRLLKLRRQTGRRQTEIIRNAVDEYLDRQGV